MLIGVEPSAAVFRVELQVLIPLSPFFPPSFLKSKHVVEGFYKESSVWNNTVTRNEDGNKDEQEKGDHA